MLVSKHLGFDTQVFYKIEGGKMSLEYATGYKFPSPLKGFENAPPLPEQRNPDKTYVNPPRKTPSKAYEEFPDPLDKTARGGFDVHVYYIQTNKEQAKYARELWERIRRECRL